MLVRALADHFQSYFNRAQHHDTVLWFDPDQEYTTLLGHLTDVPLLRYTGSLLEVRYRLIKRAPGECTVVYLPLRQEEAETLRPFFATSLIFRDRLYRSGARSGDAAGKFRRCLAAFSSPTDSHVPGVAHGPARGFVLRATGERLRLERCSGDEPG